MKTKLFLLIFAITGILFSGCVKDEVFVGPPSIFDVVATPQNPGVTDAVTVVAKVTDLKGITSVNLYYKVGTGNYISVAMTAGDNNSFSAVIPKQAGESTVAYYIQATNVSSLSAMYPVKAPESTSTYTVGAPSIVMNEIFSRGVTGNADWIELYNPASTAIDISGYKIYDSGGQSGSKGKMTLPSGSSIPAKGFFTITVDIATTIDPTGFGLSSSGEEVWLENAKGAVIDDIVFPAMALDTYSYGRKPDGSATFVTFTLVTKNASNNAATTLK